MILHLVATIGSFLKQRAETFARFDHQIAARELVAPAMMQDGFTHHASEARHAIGKPSRHMPEVERQVGTSCFSHHQREAPVRIKVWLCPRAPACSS
jgi:hypothetical protein